MSCCDGEQFCQISNANGTVKADTGERNHEIAIFVWSNQNGHWATFIREQGADHGRIYHTRMEDQVAESYFFFEAREQETHSSEVFGYSIVGHLSATERQRVHDALVRHGSQDSNIPRPERGENCQNFVVSSLRVLENERLIDAGASEFFDAHHGVPGKDIEADAQREGRHWQRTLVMPTAAPDARFHDRAPPQPRRRLDTSAYETLLSGLKR